MLDSSTDNESDPDEPVRQFGTTWQIGALCELPDGTARASSKGLTASQGSVQVGWSGEDDGGGA